MKKKLVKVKGERFIKAMTFMFLFGFILTKFVLNANLELNNAELQRLQSKIDSQEKLNTGMQMKINELASLDNALNVASAYGLEYNNTNIKVITE